MHVLGALGAAIATAISYWIVWVIRVIHMKRYLKIKLFLIRDYIAYFILVVQSIILLVFTQESIGLYLLEVALLMINITLFHDEIKSLKNIVLAKMKLRCTLFR
ncbi:MAG TPA: hypothetical protein DCM59_07845 [Clostridium sp.]|nr:hypothetical protein [Clostridium sp.]